MTKLISAFPEWANYRVIAIAEDGTVYQIRLTEDGLAGEWSKIAEGIIQPSLPPLPNLIAPVPVRNLNPYNNTNVNSQ